MTGALHFTSKHNLNNELGWKTFVVRGNMLSLSFFHKVHLHETRPLIKTCMPKLDFENTCNTRSNGGYIPLKYKDPNFEEEKNSQYTETVEFTPQKYSTLRS